MKIGDLVKGNVGTKHHGKVGIVVSTSPRWPQDPHEDEMLFEVFYPNGDYVKWSERNLLVVT